MKNWKKVFWGIYCIAAAIFVLAVKLNGFENTSVGMLFAGVLLLAIVIKSAASLWFPGVLFPIAAVAIMYDEQLGITAITPWYVLGAALLGSIGLSMLFHKKHSYCGGTGHHHYNNATEEVVEGKDFNFDTTMGGSVKYVRSDDFRSANLKASFGGMTVYFDNATILEGNSAVINVEASFGAVELYLPKEWNVRLETTAAFGAVDEKHRREEAGGPVVRVTGNASFGAIEIYYV